MAGLKPFSLLLIFIFLTATVGNASPSPPVIKAAYWPSWDSSFPPSAIDTSLFTHIYYAFLMQLNNLTYELEFSKSEAALLSNFTSTLHRKNPPVKTLLSIGGATADSAAFACMAANAWSRHRFIMSAIKVGRKYSFEGLDIDWEHPANPKEMKDYGRLMAEWRLKLEREARATGRRPLLLTAAVYYAVEFGDVYRLYPTASMSKNLDWINVMCFDYHGSWNTTFTGAHAALFDPESKISTDYGIKSWIKAGVPTKKLVMGLPLYGRTWQLKDPRSHGVGARSIGVGPGDEGQMTFSEVEDFNWQKGATVVYNAYTVSMYSYIKDSWIGYDDPMSVTMKIGFARAHGLRGYFFWAVNGDKNGKIPKQASHAWGR